MKPAIFYAVTRDLWGSGFRIIEATSEQRRQIFGRDLARDGMAVHVSVRDVLARLPDKATADSVMAKAGKIRAQFSTIIKEAQQALSKAQARERRALDDMLAEHKQ